MDFFGDEDCKIAHKLKDIHDWAHACLRLLDKQDLHQAHDIGHKILDLLNDLSAPNAVKFLAVFEVLSVGADVMDHDEACLMQKESGTTTIN